LGEINKIPKHSLRNVPIKLSMYGFPPLVSSHINFVGKYHFSLPEEVKRGELRPFHDPDDLAKII
jgi:hypothetical protein